MPMPATTTGAKEVGAFSYEGLGDEWNDKW